MTDHYQTGGISRSCIGLPGREHNNNGNHRRRTNDYDDYSEGCYDDDDQEEDDTEHDDSCCQCMRCPAHVFTSVLLGLLACILVTGGVFLAFHKWDHTWLLVSGIGVILMAIGTAMHCCSTQEASKQSHRCKGGCGGGNNVRSHHPHQKGSEIISNGHVLTEQLLPLSNARSVSQLSLNMVPGYFPPLVYSAGGAPYSLEQHSAVVQNISKLVQHQTQLHLQQPDSGQSGIDAAKSFILVPLPSQPNNAASIQNIVAAVCQLDPTNVSPENTDVQMTESVPHITRSANENVTSNTSNEREQQYLVIQPLCKHVEVQTCNNWNVDDQTASKPAGSSNVPSDSVAMTDAMPSTTAEFSCQTVETPLATPSETNNLSSEQAVALSISPEQVPNEDLVRQQTIPVSSLVSSDNSNNCDNSLVNDNSSSNLDEQRTEVPPSSNSIVTDPQPIAIPIPEETNVEIVLEPPVSCVISNSDGILQTSDTSLSANINEVENTLTDVSEDHTIQNSVQVTSMGENCVNETVPVPLENIPSTSSAFNLDLPSTSQSLNTTDSFDFEDSEFLDRSSPPPSYEDVAQETASSGVPFGISYGTM